MIDLLEVGYQFAMTRDGKRWLAHVNFLMNSRNTLEFANFTINRIRSDWQCMRKESHGGESAAIRLPQPGNLLSDEAHWLGRVEYALARVERWLESTDRVDYLIRRSIFSAR